MEDSFVETVRSGDIAELKYRLKFDDVNCHNKKKLSGLYVASQKNDQKMVDFLLSLDDIDVNVHNKSTPGHTALMIACELGHVHVARSLLNHPDLKINEKSEKNWTALMYAR